MYTLFLHICGTTVRVVFGTLVLFGLLIFLANFATVKKLYPKNLSACIIHVLDATFVPNLMFFSLLSPEILHSSHNYCKYFQN